jgi:hypothetical protein
MSRSRALSVIEFVLAHFVVTDDSFWEQSGIQDKAKRKSRCPSQRQLLSQSLYQSTIHIVQVMVNAGRPHFPKGECSSRFRPIHDAWSHLDCRFSPSLLHLLFLRLIKAGTIEEFENVYAVILNERRFTN